MKFLDHIKEIDVLIDKRKDAEYRRAIFGAGVAEAEGMGLRATSRSRPNEFGGQDSFVDGKMVARSAPNVYGGVDSSDMNIF